MYGKWVTLKFGEDIECRVWVACVPTTPEEILEQLTLNTLRNRLPEKKHGLAAGMEAISIVSDFEYSQGYGSRYEAEQVLNKFFEEINSK